MTTNFQPDFDNAAGSYTPDNLFGGDLRAITESAVIDTGNLVRGSVLGRITATGKWVLSASAASDGSQVPRAVLAENTDATAADKTTVIYVTGMFNTAALVFGAGHTAASTRDVLADAGIFMKTNQAF